MKTLKQWAKTDNAIMKSLKISEIRHVVAFTSKGDLAIMLNFGEHEDMYQFVLDAVPVEKDINKQLLKLYEGILYDKAD